MLLVRTLRGQASLKHIFHAEHITEPDEAMRRFDSTYNRSLTRRSSMIKMLSQKLDSNIGSSLDIGRIEQSEQTEPTEAPSTMLS